MDSDSLEQERGITIMAKNTTLHWSGYKFNIVDTPGHSDFGGEVERILTMVDGVILLVDVVEGPMTQTKFVLSKALKKNLPAIVVLNKLDRDSSNKAKVESDIFDLFVELGASEDQLTYPTLYASAKAGNFAFLPFLLLSFPLPPFLSVSSLPLPSPFFPPSSSFFPPSSPFFPPSSPFFPIPYPSSPLFCSANFSLLYFFCVSTSSSSLPIPLSLPLPSFPLSPLPLGGPSLSPFQ